jgi:hypothetical protein
MSPRIAIALALFLAPSIRAGEDRPAVWMMPPAAPDGSCLRELFTHPEQWQATRARIAGIGYADHTLHKQFTDEELRDWLPKLDGWGLKLALEVGAVKPWGTTGQATFRAERPMWDRFRRLGAKLDAFAMDEPLVSARNDLKKPDAYAVEETAEFIALVRQYDPAIRIGDVEPYPSIPRADLIAWIDALQASLARKNVRGLDFFRVDVDWVHFVMGHPGGWREVQQIEAACRARKLPFSLIYWAADYPHLKRRDLADDATWYISVMRQGHDYALVDGKPDEYVIESWVGAPSRAVPEDNAWTFTRSVLDFSRRFVK